MTEVMRLLCRYAVWEGAMRGKTTRVLVGRKLADEVKGILGVKSRSEVTDNSTLHFWGGHFLVLNAQRPFANANGLCAKRTKVASEVLPD
jgi:hypothetical protein